MKYNGYDQAELGYRIFCYVYATFTLSIIIYIILQRFWQKLRQKLPTAEFVLLLVGSILVEISYLIPSFEIVTSTAMVPLFIAGWACQLSGVLLLANELTYVYSGKKRLYQPFYAKCVPKTHTTGTGMGFWRLIVYLSPYAVLSVVAIAGSVTLPECYPYWITLCVIQIGMSAYYLTLTSLSLVNYSKNKLNNTCISAILKALVALTIVACIISHAVYVAAVAYPGASYDARYLVTLLRNYITTALYVAMSALVLFLSVQMIVEQKKMTTFLLTNETSSLELDYNDSSVQYV